MRKIIPILSLLILLSACQTESSSINRIDNITQDPTVMQQAWCEYNKGKEFVADQCDNINE